ncbi:hypothetical protein ACSNOI_39455 [Actinomadura kijaniata]|uniref:hypothetical protein n=1 Tax=Actinomadura kijaniata TaxID=46161 RepID=UPI003F1D39E3
MLIPWENDFQSCNLWRYGVPEQAILYGPDFTDAQGPGFVTMERDFLLPQATCRWDDGSTVNRVPWYIRLGIPLTLLAAAGSVLAARRTSTPTHAEHR